MVLQSKACVKVFVIAIFDINFINICSSFFITTIMAISFWDFLIFYQIFFAKAKSETEYGY